MAWRVAHVAGSRQSIAEELVTPPSSPGIVARVHIKGRLAWSSSGVVDDLEELLRQTEPAASREPSLDTEGAEEQGALTRFLAPFGGSPPSSTGSGSTSRETMGYAWGP